jgi:hypothetical protein
VSRELTPEEQDVFNAVYQDRVEFLKQYPKDLPMLEAWIDSLSKQKALTPQHVIATQATLKAYQDEIKRQLLLKLITNE